MNLQIDTPRWAVPFLSPARYKGAYGGRGSGKSHFFAEFIVEDHVINPNNSTVCIREVQKTLDQSVKRLLEQKIEKLNAGYYFDVQDAKVKSKFGNGLISFQGMQNHTADSIKSLEGYQRAWVEEAQTLSQYSLDLLRPTIRLPDSEILFSWNPRYKTDPVDRFFRKNPPADAVSVLVNWRENPWFPEVLRKEMNHDFATDPDKADHIWNGAYGAGQGAILARWVNQADREGRLNDVVFDPQGGPVEISCDLGFRDTAAFWYWQRLYGGYNILKYDAGTGMDVDDWIPRIKGILLEMGVKKVHVHLPHDARAKTFQSKETVIERFVKAFGADNCSVVPQSKKQDQISAARAVIQRCAFNKVDCEDGLDGLMAWEFEYNEENGVFSREPIHNWASHPADAFAYGCQVMQEKEQKPEEKLPIFDVLGHNQGRIVIEPLNDLWKRMPNKGNRI